MNIAGPAELEIRIGRRCFVMPRDERSMSVTYRQDQRRADRIGLERQTLRSPASTRLEVPGEPVTVLMFAADAGGTAAAQDLQALDQVLAARPTYILGSKRIALTNRIVVKTRSNAQSVEERLADAGLEVLERDGDVRICRAPMGQDPAATATALSTADWVDYAEPDLLTISPPLPSLAPTTEPFFVAPSAAAQPAFQQIAVDRAWALQAGRADVSVAILDDGLNHDHPALRAVVRRRYDALNDFEPATSNPWDAHGTACAGLIGGRDDEQAFRGVAAGCSLLMARISQTNGPNQPWFTSTSTIRRGIVWAIEAGAAVLSCSWGTAPAASLVDAITMARSAGRSGRGCVVVCAVGNDGGPVAFPANLAGVVAVSGVDAEDRPKTLQTGEGEPWASNQGPEVDLAAPSVRLRTTDVAGPPGRSAGDYYGRFNGTSAAAPLVAAAAALILSQNNDLREDEVRARLINAADKVGGVPYVGGRNNALGAGRLNVANALDLPAKPAASQREDPSEAVPVTKRGIVRRLDLGGQSQVFYLERPQLSPAFIAAPEIARLQGLEGEAVSYSASAETLTPLGPLLRDLRIHAPDPLVGPVADEAGEEGVRLARPEEDVFRTL